MWPNWHTCSKGNKRRVDQRPCSIPLGGVTYLKEKKERGNYLAKSLIEKENEEKKKNEWFGKNYSNPDLFVALLSSSTLSNATTCMRNLCKFGFFSGWRVTSKRGSKISRIGEHQTGI